jgi:hypothetical protein
MGSQMGERVRHQCVPGPTIRAYAEMRVRSGGLVFAVAEVGLGELVDVDGEAQRVHSCW